MDGNELRHVATPFVFVGGEWEFQEAPRGLPEPFKRAGREGEGVGSV